MSEQQPPERVWIPRTLAESLSDEQLAQTDVEYVRVQQPASEPACVWTLDIPKMENATWTSGCGKSTYYTENLHPQVMIFCPFCGKPLEIKHAN